MRVRDSRPGTEGCGHSRVRTAGSLSGIGCLRGYHDQSTRRPPAVMTSSSQAYAFGNGSGSAWKVCRLMSSAMAARQALPYQRMTSSLRMVQSVAFHGQNGGADGRQDRAAATADAARALRVEAEWLGTGKGPRTRLERQAPDVDVEICRLVSALPESARTALLALLVSMLRRT